MVVVEEKAEMIDDEVEKNEVEKENENERKK